MANRQRYERFKDDCEVLEYHNDNRTTNIWLGLICFLTFLQAIVVVGAGVTTVLFYNSNQAKVEAWINLPWVEMAHSIDTGYTGLKDAPLQGTLQNAYASTSKLRSMLDYHEVHTFKKIEEMAKEMVKNKDTLQDITNAVKQVNKALGDEQVEDITGILHSTNGAMSYMRKSGEANKIYASGKTLVQQVNHLLHPENVQRTIQSIEKLSKVMDSTFTADNVNRTIHAISDFDNSIHKAENRMALIGHILGKN